MDTVLKLQLLFNVIYRRDPYDADAALSLKFTKYLISILEDRAQNRLGYYAERDAMPGSDIFNEAFGAIRSSRFTIVVLSQKFVEEYRSNYWQRVAFVQTALSECAPDTSRVLIPIALGVNQTMVKQFCPNLCAHHILEVPINYECEQEWQDKLHKTMMSGENFGAACSSDSNAELQCLEESHPTDHTGHCPAPQAQNDHPMVMPSNVLPIAPLRSTVRGPPSAHFHDPSRPTPDCKGAQTESNIEDQSEPSRQLSTTSPSSPTTPSILETDGPECSHQGLSVDRPMGDDADNTDVVTSGWTSSGITVPALNDDMTTLSSNLEDNVSNGGDDELSLLSDSMEVVVLSNQDDSSDDADCSYSDEESDEEPTVEVDQSGVGVNDRPSSDHRGGGYLQPQGLGGTIDPCLREIEDEDEQDIPPNDNPGQTKVLVNRPVNDDEVAVDDVPPQEDIDDVSRPGNDDEVAVDDVPHQGDIDDVSRPVNNDEVAVDGVPQQGESDDVRPANDAQQQGSADCYLGQRSPENGDNKSLNDDDDDRRTNNNNDCKTADNNRLVEFDLQLAESVEARNSLLESTTPLYPLGGDRQVFQPRQIANDDIIPPHGAARPLDEDDSVILSTSTTVAMSARLPVWLIIWVQVIWIAILHMFRPDKTPRP